jgi:hypothetical protein
MSARATRSDHTTMGVGLIATSALARQDELRAAKTTVWPLGSWTPISRIP